MLTTSRFARRAVALAAVAAALVTGFAPGTSLAQSADKTAVPEAVPVAPAFGRWISLVVPANPIAPQASVYTPLAWAAPSSVGTTPYEPWPVIVGVPELPLIGTGAAAATRQWSSSFNYQGVYARLLIIDAAAGRVAVRSVASPVRAGECFKIRLAATFTAVADVGRVLGEPWNSQRAGQIYPTPGQSVQLQAGETVDLPLGPTECFVMGNNPAERLLLSVRHNQALGAARSTQPAYRIDDAIGSSYLQLAPQGQYPAVEQLISTAR